MNESINLLVPFREFSLSIYNCRNKIEEALELLIFSTIFFIVFNIILFYLIHNYRNGKSNFRFFRSTKLPEHVSRVLLVTAHPDDECMFFGPTLIALKKKNCRIFVLCMSRGESKSIKYHTRSLINQLQAIMRNKVMYVKMNYGVLANVSKLSHKTLR